MKNIVSIRERGNLAPSANFTGEVYANIAVSDADGINNTVGKVTFMPKARTNWHSHPTGQTLIIIAGTGYFQEKGKPIQLIEQGDVVKIRPGVIHWHGASPQREMIHFAIVAKGDQESSLWMEPVSDEDYNTYKPVTLPIQNEVTLTDVAIKNHELLWPDYNSTAAITDPELIEVFDNFAFDEVISHDDMDPKIRVMMIMASTIGSQALTEYKMMANAALNIGITPVEVKEVLYQAVPYVGIAKVIDFIHATNEIFDDRKIAMPIEGQSTTNQSTRQELGLAKQKEIVGSSVDNMYKNSPKDLLHIQQYLSANCFGDYITRKGLDLKIREMVTLSFLIALGGTESQIKGHVQGNANVGNDRQTLINLMTQLLPYVGYPRTLNAINCLNEILPPKK